MCRGVEAGIVFLSAQREPFWWAILYIPDLLLHFPFLGIIQKTMHSQVYLNHQ